VAVVIGLAGAAFSGRFLEGFFYSLEPIGASRLLDPREPGDARGSGKGAQSGMKRILEA
jgi:hypothetical protein